MHRMGNFIVGKFSPQLFFHFLHDRVALLRTFGKPFQHFVTHALDFKTMFGWLNPVANLLHPSCQFIPIYRRAVTNRVIHSPRLQGFPAAFPFIKCRVEHREMRMQLRIKRAGTVMHEGCRHQVASHTVTVFNTLLANTSRGEGFQFTERKTRGLLMGFNQSLVVQRDREHRNGFRRGTGEVIKHPALAFLLAPLCQPFAIVWILIFAKRVKLLARGIIP